MTGMYRIRKLGFISCLQKIKSMRSSQVLENYLTSSAGRGRLSKVWKLPQTEEILLMELLGGKKLCLLTFSLCRIVDLSANLQSQE